MLRRTTFLLQLVCALAATAAQSAEHRVAILVPDGLTAYTQASDALRQELRSHGQPRLITREFVLPRTYDDTTTADSLRRAVGAFRPDVTVVVGTPAVKWATKFVRGIPVVSCMTLGPPPSPHGESWSGTFLRISADDQLKVLRAAFSRKFKLGVLYDPDVSSSKVSDLRGAAKKAGIEMVSVPVHAAKELSRGLGGIRKTSCTVLLGLADRTVYGGTQARMILRYCLRHRIAFVGISEEFAKAGAVLALFTRPADQGRQAARMTLGILAGARMPDTYTHPTRVRIAVNMRAAKLARASFAREFLKSVDIRFGE